MRPFEKLPDIVFGRMSCVLLELIPYYFRGSGAQPCAPTKRIAKPLNEFELIDHFFAQQTQNRSDVMLGIGDDAALLQAPANQLLVTTTDTLISGVHFPIDTSPYDIGYKALAVNLSDLAAMGAEPAWVTLALTLPEANTQWLQEFTRGFFALASRYNVQLVGGDTTRGALSITVQAFGFVPPNRALRRSGAKPGDAIYVTGNLGDAGFALQQKMEPFLVRLNRPEPRIETGLALRDIATSAIDISDGLVADLGHILKASGVGASLDVPVLPISSELLAAVGLEKAWQLALTAGDDYELCFTAPPDKPIDCGTLIGHIEVATGLRLYLSDKKPFKLFEEEEGYRHF